MLEDVLLPGRLVLERDLDATVQVAGDLQPLADDLRIEFDLREDLRVGLEVDGRAGAARRADFLQAAGRLTLLEGHLVLVAVALDVATSSRDSALTTLAPTPCRPPAVL